MPARVLRSEVALREAFGEGVAFRDPDQKHDPDQARALLTKVHDKKYIDAVQALSARGGGLLDWQTYANEATYEVALLGVTAWCDGVDSVLGGGGPAFALSRPPGHHATPSEGMGFCIFCNAACAVQHALDRGCARVAVLDWDVHHGNGIQDCVAKYKDRVRFVSMHQVDAYPNADAQRISVGNTLNVPLPRGTSGKAFVASLKDVALPFLLGTDKAESEAKAAEGAGLTHEGSAERYYERETWVKPDLLVVAAGYDALAIDAVAQLSLFPEDFAVAAAALKDAFGCRVVFGLEGGYQLEQLPKAVVATLEPFVGMDDRGMP